MASRVRLTFLLLSIAILSVSAACRCGVRGDDGLMTRGPSRPPDVADPLNPDQPQQMAADDAARLRLPPGKKAAPSRRPRIEPRRRAVDQPRIRRPP